MEIGVLGPILVVGDDGVPVALRSARQRLLLAVLTVGRGRILQSDELAESLWTDALPADPIGALQSQVSRLRRLLGPGSAWIETVSPGYRFVCPSDRLDAANFERLLDDARDLEDVPATALQRLDAALSLWRGRAYQDLADRPSITPEATRLEELRADAAETRADMLLKLGRPVEAAYAVRPLLVDQPFRERPVALLMRALTLDGRHVEALREFDLFRRRLDDELGLEPSPALRAVEASVLRHDARTRPFVPTVGLPGNSFVGREAELAKVNWLLERGRLVTLTGPGGVGKTRIALHAAAGATHAYPDGIYVCELARVSDADAVAAAVSSTLHVEERANLSLVERVIEFLLVQRALLVIDNCEHVLSAVAELVTAVLSRTAHVDVLATSRERLGIDGEHRVPVGPLPTPPWDDPTAPSVVLFIDRARAVRPDFSLASGDMAAVSELCRRVDGLPLAIELAAAQVVSSSPSEILDAITDRLGGLADARRTVQRHRTLDALFRWSYDLLAPAEQQAFERLSVFAGGCTAEMARAVAGADASNLMALVECSLVTARFEGSTRFSMLEPVREFAETRLAARGDLHEARARFARWVVDFAENANAGLCGPDEVDWRAAFNEEFANLRAAHLWCLEHDPESCIRLAGSMYRFIWSGAPSEVSTWAGQAVSRFPEVSHPRLPAAYAAAALGRSLRGDLAGARILAEKGIANDAGDPVTTRFAWEALGDIETWLGNFDGAMPLFDRAAELARRAGDDHQAAISLFDRAVCPAYCGRVDEAIEACDALSSLVTAVKNPSLDAWSDYINGEVRLDRAPVQALTYLRQSAAAGRRIGNRVIVGAAGLSVVSCEARVGDPNEALAQYGEIIDHWQRDGSWNMVWTTLRTLVELLTRLRRDADAARLYGAMEASTTAAPLAGADAARIAEAVATVRGRLGDSRFEGFRTEGAALSDDEAVAYALQCVGPRQGRDCLPSDAELTAD